MKHQPLAHLAFLAATSLGAGDPSLSAGVSLDPAAAEAAVRKSDADWAVTGAAGADAWTAFYSADAILSLPNDRPASGKDALRAAVTRLLAQPHTTLISRPIRVDVADSGDLAVLIGVYELRHADSAGVMESAKGRRLEIWRRQADGSWKCSVDNWNLDEPIATPLPSAQGASAIPSSSAPPAPAAAAPPAPARVVDMKYGGIPTDYEAAIRKYFLEHLRDPDSVQYREITRPEQGYTTMVTGAVLMRESRQYGWTVKATINAKNSRDSYAGFKTYTFLFRGEKIVDVRMPLPGDEINHAD